MAVLLRILPRLVGLLGFAPDIVCGLLAAVQECLAAYQRVIDQLRLTAAEEPAAARAFVTELSRRLPAVVTVLALTALLPLVVDRARRRFEADNATREEAEDLAQEVGERVLRACYGNWPRGNVGALVAAVADRARCDRLRRRARDEKVRAWAENKCRAAGC